MVDGCSTLYFSCRHVPRPGMWIFDEPIFNKCFLSNPGLSIMLKTTFIEAGVLKLRHLSNVSVERVTELMGIQSTRVLQSLVERVWLFLSAPLGNWALADHWSKGHEFTFPELTVSPAGGERWPAVNPEDASTEKFCLLQVGSSCIPVM